MTGPHAGTSMNAMTGPRAAVRPDAQAGAEAAARAAGVHVRELADVADLENVCRLLGDIWQTGPRQPLVTTELLRALAKSGNYVVGALDGDRLVGACVGFFGAPDGRTMRGTMHSHIAGVAADMRGRSVGFALKTHQRAWALRHGVDSIAWTFDPLVSRNAYFNVVKLGATAVEYLPNFYGNMRDGMNGGDASDRLLVRWDLVAPDIAAGGHDDAVTALGRSPRGLPVPGSRDGRVLLVAVPEDVATLRATDPGLATRWRAAVREALTALLGAGARITGFDRERGYVLTR